MHLLRVDDARETNSTHEGDDTVKIRHWFGPNTLHHGPQKWEWWRLAAFHYCELTCYDHTHLGRRIWVYTRWFAFHVDYHNDADMLWQHCLDKCDVLRHEVFENRFSRPVPTKETT